MATWMIWTPEQHQEWARWLAERPPVVRDLAERFPPYKLYRLHVAGHRVYPLSYCEDGTMTVAVSGQFNWVVFERQVFGIRPADLTECELPTKGEAVGSAFATPADWNDGGANTLSRERAASILDQALDQLRDHQ